MDPVQREIKRKRVMLYFIETARKIIDEEGMEHLTLKKVAARTGYTSVTFYNYFENIEHLSLLCALTYLREYTDALNVAMRPEMNALERFRTVLTVYDAYAFRAPEVFYNLFVGKYSDKLITVVPQYYELFPEDLQAHIPEMKQMLTLGAMSKRDALLVEALAAEGFVKPERSAVVAELITRVYQSYLLEMCVHKAVLDPEEQHRRFMNAFDYIIHTGK